MTTALNNKADKSEMTTALNNKADKSEIPKSYDDVGAAPAGYGLGGNAKTVTSADNITANGYYETAITIGGVTDSCIVWHNQHGINNAEQFAVSVLGGFVGSGIHRIKKSGTWQPWEWVNPPMVVGVEYRTTERCDGKVVYAKRTSYTIANDIKNETGVVDISIAHGISNFDSIVRCSATKDKIYSFPMVHSYNGGTVIVSHFTANELHIRNWKYNMDAGTITFNLYYTKTK